MAKRRKTSVARTSRLSNRNRPWSDLTEPVLYSILSRLSSNFFDFYAFSGVCTAWKSIAKAFEKELFASTPPMFMLRLANSRALRFHSITDSIYHRTSRIQVKTKNCVGVSFGYLIIVDRSWRQPSLVDPFTSTTIRLPKQSFRIRFAILTAPPSSSDCLLLGWGSYMEKKTSRCRFINAVAVCELKGSGGMVKFWPYPYQNAIFCHGKAFVLLGWSGIMVMDLVLHPKPMLIAVTRHSIPTRMSSMLVEAGDDLLLVSQDFEGRILVEAHSLDLKREGWVRLTSLGGRALFLSFDRCEVSENAAGWGGEDCVYMVSRNTVVRQSLKDGSTKVVFGYLPRHVNEYGNYGWVSPISNQHPI